MIIATRSVMPPSRGADLEVVFMFSFLSSARQDRLAWTAAVRHADERRIDVALVVVARGRDVAGNAQAVCLVVGVLARLVDGARKDVDLRRHDLRRVGCGA